MEAARASTAGHLSPAFSRASEVQTRTRLAAE
jgi:hypothetical protein